MRHLLLNHAGMPSRLPRRRLTPKVCPDHWPARLFPYLRPRNPPHRPSFPISCHLHPTPPVLSLPKTPFIVPSNPRSGNRWDFIAFRSFFDQGLTTRGHSDKLCSSMIAPFIDVRAHDVNPKITLGCRNSMIVPARRSVIAALSWGQFAAANSFHDAVARWESSLRYTMPTSARRPF